MAPNKRKYDQTNPRPYKEFLEKKSDDDILELIQVAIREGLKKHIAEVPGERALRDITLYHLELLLLKNRQYHHTTTEYFTRQIKEKTKAWDDIELKLASPSPLKKPRELTNLQIDTIELHEDLDHDEQDTEQDTEYEEVDPEPIVDVRKLYALKNIKIKKEKNTNNGVSPRPRGKAPAGKVWDYEYGCWKDVNVEN
jgi:hypothetical protein